MAYLYEKLAVEVAERIDQGILQAEDRLPGVRTFSGQRNISVATAVAAYCRLEDDGYIEARPRSGFYIRPRSRAAIEEPKISKPQSRPTPVTGQQLVLQLVKAANDPAIVQLGAAVPDPAFLPTQAVQRALSNAVRDQRTRSAAYAFPPGVPELRQQIARRLAETGCGVRSQEVVITSGCQEALTLALRAVTCAGDVVAIESPTFYGLLQVIDSLGLKALEIPTHPPQGRFVIWIGLPGKVDTFDLRPQTARGGCEYCF